MQIRWRAGERADIAYPIFTRTFYPSIFNFEIRTENFNLHNKFYYYILSKTEK